MVKLTEVINIWQKLVDQAVSNIIHQLEHITKHNKIKNQFEDSKKTEEKRLKVEGTSLKSQIDFINICIDQQILS